MHSSFFPRNPPSFWTRLGNQSILWFRPLHFLYAFTGALLYPSVFFFLASVLGYPGWAGFVFAFSVGGLFRALQFLSIEGTSSGEPEEGSNLKLRQSLYFLLYLASGALFFIHLSLAWGALALNMTPAFFKHIQRQLTQESHWFARDKVSATSSLSQDFIALLQKPKFFIGLFALGLCVGIGMLIPIFLSQLPVTIPWIARWVLAAATTITLSQQAIACIQRIEERMTRPIIHAERGMPGGFPGLFYAMFVRPSLYYTRSFLGDEGKLKHRSAFFRGLGAFCVFLTASAFLYFLNRALMNFGLPALQSGGLTAALGMFLFPVLILNVTLGLSPMAHRHPKPCLTRKEESKPSEGRTFARMANIFSSKKNGTNEADEKIPSHTEDLEDFRDWSLRRLDGLPTIRQNSHRLKPKQGGLKLSTLPTSLENLETAYRFDPMPVTLRNIKREQRNLGLWGGIVGGSLLSALVIQAQKSATSYLFCWLTSLMAFVLGAYTFYILTLRLHETPPDPDSDHIHLKHYWH